MLARLLVRWPRTSRPLLTARSLSTTPLIRAESACLLKPTLAPEPARHVPVSVPAPAPTARSHLAAMKFADAPISDKLKKAIKHEFMTDVQEATLELGIAGEDLLVQAKTGTGKTAAFLLPAIEQLARKKTVPPGNKVSVLVLSPTRELAMQIVAEARTLLKNQPYRVQCVIGGVRIHEQMTKLRTERCDILVATPGRLLDLMQQTRLQDQLGSLQTIVLDEADRLLDIGFTDTLNSILEFLPDREQHHWQCMLYSATLSKDVKKIASQYLVPGYKFVSTLTPDEVNTHEHVPQTCVTVPMSDTLKALLAVLQEDRAENGSASKAMVFCTTVKGTAAIAKLLQNAGGNTIPRIFSIQSQMSQSGRLNVAERFKTSRSAILVTSDVTARGMDFPGVTLVVQLGVPSSPEQYIHRLGRTARAGKPGKGVIILTPPETGFLRTHEMRDLPIHPHHKLELAELPPSPLDDDAQREGYIAWFGFNSSMMKTTGMRKRQLVEEGNAYLRGVLGWTHEELPHLPAKLAISLGLTGDGLNVHDDSPSGWGQRRRSDSGGWQSRSRGGGGYQSGRWDGKERGGSGSRGGRWDARPRDGGGYRGGRSEARREGTFTRPWLGHENQEGETVVRRRSSWRDDREDGGEENFDFGGRRRNTRDSI